MQSPAYGRGGEANRAQEGDIYQRGLAHGSQACEYIKTVMQTRSTAAWADLKAHKNANLAREPAEDNIEDIA